MREKSIFFKLKKILKKGFYIIEFILSIFLAIFFFKIIYDKLYLSIVKVQNIIAFLLLTAIIVIMIGINVRKEYQHYEKLFLTFMIPIGIFYLVFLLPCNVPDESNHMKRIVDISQGNVIMDVKEQKQYIPKQIAAISKQNKQYDDIIQKMSVKQDYSQIDTEGQYNHFSSYFPIPYLLPSLVFKVGISLNWNLFIIIYLARMVNFIVALLLGYYAIMLLR